MKKTIGTLMVAVSAIAVASSASALEFTPYVGLDYTHTTANTKGAEGFRPDYDGASVNVGTNYNRFFGTELFYQKTDKDNKNTGTDGKLKSEFQAYGLDLMGYLPLYGCDNELALIGTAGIGMYDFSTRTHGVEGISHDEGIGYRLGTGLQYNIDENWAVRGIARYIAMDKTGDAFKTDHMMEYSAGVRYTF